MIKVRKASNEDYYDTAKRRVPDGLSCYIAPSTVYYYNLQYIRNNCDIWLVCCGKGKETTFWIARNMEQRETSRRATREQFLDFVMANTPEAFDWCLFHLFCDPIEIEVCDD